MLSNLLAALFSMLKSSHRVTGRTWTEELLTRVNRSILSDALKQHSMGKEYKGEDALPFHPSIKKIAQTNTSIAGIRCTVVEPKRVESKSAKEVTQVILYLHGGGYTMGSAKMYLGLIAELAVNSHARVIAPDYGLAPKHVYPAAYEDCLAVAKEVINMYADLPIAIVGDSAGGALAIAVALHLSKSSLPKPKPQDISLVLLSPWVEPTAESGSMKDNLAYDIFDDAFLYPSYARYIADGDPYNHHSNFVDVDLSGLPTTYVQYGAAELFYDQIKDFSNRARAQGVDLNEEAFSAQPHIFQVMSPFTATARQAMRKIAEFINH